jgi:hypothetical protein
MSSYRVLVRRAQWRRFFLASTASRLPVTMGVFGMVLAGRALGSFALGARLAAVYTLTGAATAVWRGRRLDRGDLRRGLRRDGALVAVVAIALAACVRAHAPWAVLAVGAVALGAALAGIPGAYRSMLPAVVPADQVGAGYAVDAVCVEACFVFGPAFAAAVAWFAGAGAVFVLMAGCALVGALAAGRLPSVDRRGLRAAAATAPHRVPAVVGALVGAVAAGSALGVFDATFPALASSLGTRAAAGGILITLTATGSATAGLLLGPRIAAARDLPRRASQVLVVFGVTALPLAFVPTLGGVAVVALVAGAPFALMSTAAAVLVQRRVQPARTAEAFSLLNAGLLAGSAAGSAAASAVLGPFGARGAVAVASVAPVTAGTCLLAVLSISRRRRRADGTAGPTAPAGPEVSLGRRRPSLR